jgi:hypothetical protein
MLVVTIYPSKHCPIGFLYTSERVKVANCVEHSERHLISVSGWIKHGNLERLPQHPRFYGPGRPLAPMKVVR